MQSVLTEETNTTLGPPPDWDQENMPMTTLHATRVNFTKDGYEPIPGFMSYWAPTPEELEVLNKGGLIELSVLGKNHPPVQVGVIGAKLLEANG